MVLAFEFVATLSTTLFCGAAIYINLVEHPARMGCDTKTAAMVWAPSYRRATVMQATLAILGFVGGTAAWDQRPYFLVSRGRPHWSSRSLYVPGHHADQPEVARIRTRSCLERDAHVVGEVGKAPCRAERAQLAGLDRLRGFAGRGLIATGSTA